MTRSLASCVLPSMMVLLCGCTPSEPAAFTLKTVPEAIEDTIPGQDCVLLVSFEQEGLALLDGHVQVTATADGANAVVENGTIGEGELAEVTVTMLDPDDGGDQPGGEEGWPCSVTVRGERNGVVHTVEVPITITTQEPDTRRQDAAAVRDRFVHWLAENRPELGIDHDTEWEGTIVKPHWLVVGHYLYFSDEWEMHASWHVMIAPHDWARIELRHRFEESLPSLAFEIPSRSATGPIVVNEIEPESVLWR